MMMPANYSAIAENEMTYVVGGGLLEAIGSVTAPVWGAANVKTFNTNLINLIGNSYVEGVVKNTLGTAFGGFWGTKTGEKDGDKDVKVKIFGKHGTLYGYLNKDGEAEMSFLNKTMQGLGTLAAIYTLGTSTAKTVVGEKVMGVNGIEAAWN